MRCFISNDKFFSEEDWGNSAKLATIWFDEIILQASSKGLTESLTYKQAEKEHWSNETLDEVNRVWSDVHKYIPEYDFIGLTSALEGIQPQPYKGHHELTKIVRDLLIDEWKQQKKKYKPFCPINKIEISDDFEVNRDAVEAIDLWFSLRSNMDCTFLSGLTEDRVLRKLLPKPSEKSEFDVFSEFTSAMIPGMTNWSWDKVMEIRNNQELTSFREKITSVWNSLDTGNVDCATNILKELFYSDLENLAFKYKPDLKSTIFKGVMSNFPLSFPFNPISMYISVEDSYREHQAARKYGWLYFIIDNKRKVNAF